MRVHLTALCMALLLGTVPMHAQSAEQKALEAKQQAYRDRGRKALDAETAREHRGDCKTESNTIAVDACMTREMAITDANYKSFALALGGILRLSVEGDEAKAAELGRKFDASEALWANFRKAECDTVYQYNIAGTVRGFAYGTCMQTLERQHMHGLAAVYTDFVN